MKNRILIVALKIILVTFLSGCIREFDRDFLRVLTHDATGITGTGVTLNGEILNLHGSDSPEFGFLIYLPSTEILKIMGRLEGEPGKNGKFSARAVIGMIEGEEYSYSAYVKNGNFTNIGNVCSFKSNGGISAEILNISPASGSILDTILIRLSGNIGSVSDLDVSFGNQQAQIVDFYNDVLKVVVPATLGTKLSTVSITTGGITESYDQKFELIAEFPEITGFSPAQAYPGEIITINGINFSPIALKNVVKFNNTIAITQSSTATQMQVIAPDLEGQDCKISVTVGTLHAEAAGEIKILALPPPQITGFGPVEGYPGSIVNINGINFHPDPSKIDVRFNGVKAFLVSNTTTQILVYAPDLPGMDCQISVTSVSQTAVAGGTFRVLGTPVTWKKLADHPGGEIYKMGSFMINEYGYTGLGSRVYHNYNLKFWRYNFTNDSWTEVASFPGNTRIQPYSFTIDGKGYSGGGSSYDNSTGIALRDFYEYEPVTNSWTRLMDYPGNLQNQFFGFSEVVNNTAYIAFTRNDFYSFKPSENKWTKLPVPASLLNSGSGSFVVGDYVYFLGGSDTEGVYRTELWAFNTVTLVWLRKKDFPGQARYGATAFSIDGKGYYGLGRYSDFWRYDPVTDSWFRIQDYAGGSRSAPFCFVINNMAYIGTGYLSPNKLAKDVYRFFPYAK